MILGLICLAAIAAALYLVFRMTFPEAYGYSWGYRRGPLKGREFDWTGLLFGPLLGALGWFIVMLVSWGVLTFSTGTVVDHVEKSGLVSIGSGSKTVGDFYLGYGTVDGKRTVRYAASSDGGVRLGEVDAGKSLIRETAPAGSGTLETIVHGRQCDPFWTGSAFIESGRDWVFTVPAGTVSREFSIGNN